MRGQLSTEIRLQTTITRLKNGTVKLRKENSILKQTIKEKDKEIKILESKISQEPF
jgi:predicted RNase H-like nuclease (RuvC/YqgF family)